MNTKKTFRWTYILIVIALLLAGCGGKPAQPTPTATPIPPTATPIPPTPTPTAIPASHDPITVGNFEFQITEVRIANEINNLPAGPLSNYKGALVMTATGYVPKAAQSGNVLLMIFMTLQTGDNQAFLDSDLKIIVADSRQSAVAILTQSQDNRVIWVYDVNPSSRSFLLVFPDDVMLDLTPLIP